MTPPPPPPPPARVDVLIPVFNVAATIEESVGSILRQSVRDIRVVVVDDGSTDDTRSILARIQSADPRVTTIRVPHGGIVDALNIGLAQCSAPVVARHDADDIAFADRFATQLAYLDAYPDCIAVGANAWHIDAAGKRIGTRTTFDGDVTPDFELLPAREPYLMHPFLMVRRAAIVAVGGYRHAFHSEDSDLYWRLLDHGRLHNLPDILGEYRLHAASISGTSALNGRISAVNSQLAALSHRRRMLNRTDIPFPREALAVYQRAATLEAIVGEASRGLDAHERAHIELGAGLKLLWLAEVRSYPLSDEDHRIIACWLEARWSQLAARQRGHARWQWRKGVTYLLHRGEWRQAVMLAGRPLRLVTLLAYVARGAVGDALRRLRPGAA